MDNSTKLVWSLWLTTIGMALTPAGGLSIPAGLPAWVGASVALIGVVCFAIGNAMKHQVTTSVASQQSSNTDVITKAQAAGTLPVTPIAPKPTP